MPKSASGQRRRQRPRGTVTREQVVNAALDVTDRVGVERMTIRAVAAAAGAPPMSLYTHFSNKSQLLDLMYVEISRRMYEDSGHPDWQSELVALAQRVRGVLREHPRWAPLLSRPAQPLAVPVRERILKSMTEDGIAVDDAFLALSAATLQAIGLTLVELSLRGPDGESTLTKRFQRLKEWVDAPGEDAQITRQAVSRMPQFDLDPLHEFSIRVFVEGLLSRCAHHPPTR